MFKNLSIKTRKYEFIFSIIATLVSLLADTLQPLAPVIFYVLIISLLCLIGIIAINFLKPEIKYKAKSSLAFFFSTLFLFSTLFTLLNQSENSNNEGVLSASGLMFVKDFQTSMGIVKNDLSAIKETLEKVEETTKESVEATVQVVETIKESTKEVVLSIENIQKSFNALDQSGGIIKNASTPEQFYHNARIFELNGDYGNARRSYNKFFSFELDLIDPHLRYQTFLKIQEGRSGAREVYNALFANDPRPIIEFTRILLFEGTKRLELLENYAEKYPDFGLVYLELSKEYSPERKGQQSISEKRLELKFLKEFIGSLETGSYFKLFLDKEFASNQIETAKIRLLALQSDNTISSPILLSLKPHKLINSITLCCEPLCTTPQECAQKQCREKFEWVDIGKKGYCLRETKQETIIDHELELKIQINESSSSPELAILETETKEEKSLLIKNLQIASDNTEFFAYIKPNRAGQNSQVLVSYLDNNNEKQGPFKLPLKIEKYYLEFVENLIKQKIDPELPITDDRIKTFPGNPYAHFYSVLDPFELRRLNLLHIAVANNNISVVKRLIEHGVNINGVMKRFSSDKCTNTPLIIASNHGHIEMVKILIENGADQSYSGRYGSALDIAKYRKFIKIEEILESTQEFKPLPCRCGATYSDECLISKGIEPEKSPLRGFPQKKPILDRLD